MDASAPGLIVSRQPPSGPFLRCRRLQAGGEEEVRAASARMDELAAQVAALELDVREKEDEIQGLQVRAVVCAWGGGR